MNECIDCDRPCYYRRCSLCQDAFDDYCEQEAKAMARAEEWEA